LGLSLVGLWAAYTYVPRANLIAAGLASVAALAILYRYPVLGTFLATFLVTSGAASYFPGSVSGLLTAVVMIFLARRLMAGHAAVPIIPLVRWAILLFVWQVFSAVWAKSYDWLNMSGLYRSLLVLLAITWTVERPRDFLWLTVAATGGIILTSVMSVRSLLEFLASGVLAQPGGLEQHVPMTRYYGLWRDPNLLAQTIIPFWGLLYAVNRTRLSLPATVVTGAGLVMGVVAVLISLSRAGMLCLGVMTLVILFGEKRRWVLLGTLAGIVALTITLLPVDVIGRVGTITSGRADASISQRTDLMLAGLRMFTDSFPFGVGIGNFRTYCMDYAFTVYNSAIPHNTYTEILSECGLPGIILFLGAMASVVPQLKRGRHRIVKGDFQQNLRTCMRGVFLSMLVSYMFLSMSTYVPYWLVLALMGSLNSVFLTQPIAAGEIAVLPRDASIGGPA
jgi:O-antigen ligase